MTMTASLEAETLVALYHCDTCDLVLNTSERHDKARVYTIPLTGMFGLPAN